MITTSEPDAARIPSPRGVAAAAASAVLLLLAGAGPLPGQEIEVGPDRQVSAPNPERGHYEVRIAAHPDDPDVLLAASMVMSDTVDRYDVRVYRSSDGGESWEESLNVDPGGGEGDPDLAFGPEGRAYLVEMGHGPEVVHRSPDGGRTWAETIPADFGDRPFLAVSGAGAEHPGRVHVHSSDRTEPLDGERGKSAISVLSLDGSGSGVVASTTRHVDGDRYVLGNGESAVLSDGTLVLLYPERTDHSEIHLFEGATAPDPRKGSRPNARLKALVSRDGGESFGPARTVGRWYHRFGRGRAATVPALAADPSSGPFRDRLYAAWTDFRSGEGQILLSHSEDRGKSWSDPVVVNRGGGPAFRPMLAVNDEGVLGIAWYDRRESDSGLGYAVRFAASLDGGETVEPGVRVSEEAFRYDWEAGLVTTGRGGGGNGAHRADVSLHSFNEIGGHTAGLAADASGTFHPLWVDNRTGVSQAWTAPVTVKGEAVRHGDRRLSELRDLTSRTALRVERTDYGGAPGVVTLEARLRNTSGDTVRGPLHLRVVDLWSELGDARMATSGDGETGPGAAIPLSGAVPGGALAPGQESGRFEIRARIESPAELGPKMPPPPGRRPGAGYGLLNLELVTLGRLQPEDDG
jgi:hypothetical protein